MKKIYSSFFLIIASLSINAQVSVFQLSDNDNANAIVSNNAVFTRNVAAGSMDMHHFKLKNVSLFTQTITIRKHEDLLNTVNSIDMAQALFCTGITCYPPTVFNVDVVLAPGETTDFIADLHEASIVGESNLRYELTNTNDASDVMIVYLKYNLPTNVSKQFSIISSVSSVFPNPSTSKTFISINATKETRTQITIINATGSLVYSTSVDLYMSNNTVQLNTENLNSGIYFVSILNGNAVVTRKITITK